MERNEAIVSASNRAGLVSRAGMASLWDDVGEPDDSLFLGDDSAGFRDSGGNPLRFFQCDGG